MPRLRLLAAVVLAVASVAVAQIDAGAQTATPVGVVVAPPRAQDVGFAPPQAVVSKGSGLSFVSVDPTNQHDLRSVAESGNGTPLFTSALITAGQSSVVAGVDKLAAGAYEFYCSLHSNMSGTLTVLGPGGGTPPPAVARRPSFTAPMPIPKVKTGDNITIRVRRAAVPALPGAPTQMYTYDGTFPGPTIRRPAGRQTKVTFVNDLPGSASPLTVHLHGGHNSTHDDGQPDANLIPHGTKRTYTYSLRENGGPERAAFEWYHDHRIDVTGAQVWKGLAGMFIVDDDVEKALPLPKGDYDVPIMLAERSFDGRNQLTEPFGYKTPPGDEVVGDVVLANGRLRPYFEVADRKYRLRLLNASNFTLYNVRLSNGAPLTQIGTESGLLPAPVARDSILLGPAERAEVLVDFSQMRGQRVVLESVARTDGGGLLGSGVGSKRAPVLQFRVTKRAADRSRVPATLRALPDLQASPVPTPGRVWIAGLGFDSSRAQAAWTLNGHIYEGSTADARPALGSTETWLLTNPTTVSHVIHIHGTDWQMLSRNGRAPPAWEAGLKETFLLDPGDTVIVAGRLTDHLGRFLVHCHMLEHEDHGMMSQYEVVPPPLAAPAAIESASEIRSPLVLNCHLLPAVVSERKPRDV